MCGLSKVTAACTCLTSVLAMVLLSGCTTASSLGLPVASGPHQLLPTAERFRDQAGRAAPLPRELAKEVWEYRVEPGDVLTVEPHNFDSNLRLPSDQPVQPDGSIELGRYGRVQVVGLTVAEIESKVRAAIASQRSVAAPEWTEDRAREQEADVADDSASVRLVNRESKVFYVVGEVNAPGTYPLAGRETILDAIMAAGGLTDRANEHKLLFARPTFPGDCRVVLPICYRQIVQLGDTSTNYQIRPGDRIYVPSFTLHDDVKQFLMMGKEPPCPRCSRQAACYGQSCGRSGCLRCGPISSSRHTHGSRTESGQAGV